MSRLSLPQLQAVRRLMRAGVRHTEIARRMDLAAATISRIAADRRLRRRKLELLDELDLPEDDQPPEYVARNLRRCPDCGGMVYQWPCLTCRMRWHAGWEGEAPAEHGDEERERGREGEREKHETMSPSPSPTLPLPHSPTPLTRSFTTTSELHRVPA